MIRRLLYGVLMIITLLACVETEDTVAPGQGQDSETLSGLILVTGARGRLTVIHPDGAEARELRGPTGPGRPSLQPTWAPPLLEGTRLVAWTELTADGTFQIVLADLVDGSEREFEAPVAPFYYYWSPDASYLGFLGQNAFEPLQMGVVDLGRDTLEIVGQGQPFYFDWRSDSRAMVTHVGDALAMLIREDGVWSSGTLAITPGLFQAPAWVSFNRILVATPASSGSVQVGVKGLNSTQDILSSQKLVVIDPDGRSVSTLAELEGPTAFGPDSQGLRVAFTDFNGPLRVWDGVKESSTDVSAGKTAAFQWSPDGTRLLFMEVDATAQALVPKVWDGIDTLVYPSFTPTRVFLLQYLPFWDQYSRSLTLWEPGGEAFVYPAATAEGDRIMVQHLGDSRPEAVSEGVFASWSPGP